MQFYSFLKNIEFILKSFDKNKSELTQQTNLLPELNITASNGQLGLFAQAVQTEVNKSELHFNTTLITDTTDFENMIDNLSKASVIALKVFADVKNAVNSSIYGIALGVNSGYEYNNSFQVTNDNLPAQTYYIPISHNIENQLNIEFVKDKLKTVFENPSVKKITHDIKSEYNVLKLIGIEIQGVIFDTLLASYIKDSNANADFDIQCMERIEHVLPTVISDNKKMKFNNLDLDTVKNYTGDVIASLFKLSAFWNSNLDEKEHNIFETIEIPLAHVLANMEFNGVTVDVEYLKTLTTLFDKKLSKLESRIFELADEGFNINSPKQVGYILFDKLQLKSRKKRGKSKNSTSAEVLTALAEDYEIARLLLEYRKFAKLKSTYTDSLPALIDSRDNRIHSTYNQAVTVTGRLSSSNPNLQNIPTRSEEGNKIRQAFVPENKNNSLILSADYSQIELRLLAHISEDENLIDAFNSGIDVHTLTASKVFEVAPSEVTKEMRYKSKAVNFGIVYGQSKYGLAKALKITPQESEMFIDKYFLTYPGIRAYMQDEMLKVEEKGYVETIFGRKRYLLNEINSSNSMVREFAKRAAINHPIQGTASDLMKLAMIDFAAKLKEYNLKTKMIMQVHDELVLEVDKSELEQVKKLVVEAMELGQPLDVPLVVDINIGESWKEL